LLRVILWGKIRDSEEWLQFERGDGDASRYPEGGGKGSERVVQKKNKTKKNTEGVKKKGRGGGGGGGK